MNTSNFSSSADEDLMKRDSRQASPHTGEGLSFALVNNKIWCTQSLCFQNGAKISAQLFCIQNNAGILFTASPLLNQPIQLFHNATGFLTREHIVGHPPC